MAHRARLAVMTTGPLIAEVAALVGDPARANMLTALMAGKALTASELAYVGGVAPPTASGHLAKLAQARLVVVATQGRHRYFRLASVQVARMLEGLMAVAVDGPPRHRPTGPRDKALAAARTCYDHLAGGLGVGLADALTRRGLVQLDDDGGAVTDDGHRFLVEFGIDLQQAGRSRRIFCRPCLDWSERRWHIGGAVGAALADRCFGLGWIARVRDTRAVSVTPAGRSGFAASFGLEIDEGGQTAPKAA